MLCLGKIIYQRSWKISPNQSILEGFIYQGGTGIAYSEKLCAFVNSIPEVHQQHYKEFVDSRLFRWQEIVSDTIMKNNFSWNEKSKTRPKEHAYT